MVSVMVPMCEWYAILAGICACWSKPSVNGNETRKREKIRQTQWASKRQVRWVRSFFLFPFVRSLCVDIGERERDTYVSITVERVVGQLDFVEDDRLSLPMRSKCWTVWMNVHALCALWFCATSRYPLGAREFVTAIADRGHFEYHTIVRILLHASQCNAKRREHSPAKREKEEGKS